MNLFLLNVLLAIAWGALTSQFYPVNLIFGYLLGFFLLWIIFRNQEGQKYFERAPKIIEFLLFFIAELLKANLRVARIVLTPRPRIHPGVIAVPLDLQTDIEITLLTNLLTLTPGTLSLDVSADHRMLYLHTIDFSNADEFRSQIKNGFERRVMEIMR
ncbi:MAG: Na+/H+ antiporter subunit E [Anaerolineales bacterium]|nr:Na+/H+ antiporter subunit E [Anaerolineales bacterium]